MKKLVSFLAAVSMIATVLSFASCGNTETGNTNTDLPIGDNDIDVNEIEENADAQDADEGEDAETGDEVEEDKEDAASDDSVIKMATNAYFKPYEFYDGDKIVGIDAEIAEKIAERIGCKLEIVDMQFDSILTSVVEGAVDFGMAGMTVTEERLENVNFTTSYASGVQSIIVTEDSPIASLDDLYGDDVAYKVGVQLGTTGDLYSSDDFGEDRVIQYKNGNEAALALTGGAVDCVIIDNQPAKALVDANEGLKILDTSYADEDYAICVAKDNEELLDKLNVAIDELIADGTVDEILAKYIK